MTMDQLPEAVVLEFSKRLGIAELPPEVRRAVAQAAGPEAIAAFLVSLAPQLTPDDRRFTDECLGRGDAEALLAHLTVRIPDFYQRLDAFFGSR